MKQFLEPVTRIPGVRAAMLMTPDGVPITVHGERRAPRTGDKGGAGRRRSDFGIQSTDDIQACAALATGWMSEVMRSVAPLSWAAPQRLVLQAARGTLILTQAPGAILLVVLDAGLRAEELRLPMEGVVVRMQRHLRRNGSRGGISPELDSQPTVLPVRSESRDADDVPSRDSNWVSKTGNVNPEVSGD